jgi:hypothetical protein
MAMSRRLQETRKAMEKNSRLAGFTVRQEGDEVHLSRDGESFARLFPGDKEGIWRVDCFRNMERWEKHVQFSGPLEACLELVADDPPHYFFWGG